MSKLRYIGGFTGPGRHRAQDQHDDTWDHMREAAARYPKGRVRCVDLGANKGKRAAMAAGIRATSAEILVFVDSDSMPAPGSVRLLVQGPIAPCLKAVAALDPVDLQARPVDLDELFLSYYRDAGESGVAEPQGATDAA